MATSPNTPPQGKVYIESDIDREIFSLVESVAKEEGISTQEWIDRAVTEASAYLKK